jgi:hypothetical protein
VRHALATFAVLAGAAVACGHDHGPAHVRGLPNKDDKPALRTGAARSPRLANYKIDAKLDASRHTISASETLTWTNGGSDPVDTLPFHLYLNAFKNEQSLFMRSSHGSLRGAHASDGGWGYIDVRSIAVDGVPYQLRFTDPAKLDQTVAEVKLAAPIPPGGHVTIDISFDDQLPEVFARTGYKGDFHMIGQWFPKIGVRVGPPGSERWSCEPFHSNSEFFADFGVYDVTLTVPSTHGVAATGVLVASTESPGGTRTFTYHAEDVHDFAWMADPYMDLVKGTADPGDGGPPVEVRVYFRGEQREYAHRHLEAAIGTIEKMSAEYGPYPWSIMSVIDPPVDAAAGAGGMEYPTLVTTGGDSVYARPGMHLPEYVTVHEVGHNWFQGMLASNETDEAWLDEGVNEWADGKVMDELYGVRTGAIDWLGWQAETYALRRALADDPAHIPSPIATASYAFVDTSAYHEATYASTMRALHTLELTVGSARFAAAMKAYAQAWAFKHPTGRDLFDTLGKELGQDLTWFFGPVFHEVGGLALSVRSTACRPYHEARGVIGDGKDRVTRGEIESPDTGAWTCEVVVQNTGTIHVPVDVELRFEDGSTQRSTWNDHGDATWQRIEVNHSTRLTEVRLDPDGKLQLDQATQHDLRVDGDGAAGLRAGAWVAALAQTLMQAVGP